ncbi:hypothetical protein PR202_ga14258 [Eleusine coracana subsp. coracana]|uniref:Uncharacterized protein n=1 Tax=Eleusine coracana subsp. coracana TaxID=191504 RepID=A0AAV5CGC2_ELECO|nr:hypothetical protein PR202_ga14258 [Eleusine coracana subsp. coracana]
MQPIKVYADRRSQPSRAVIIFCRLVSVPIVVMLDFVMTKLLLLSQSCHFEISCVSIPWSSGPLVCILPTCSPEPKLSQFLIGITRIYVVAQVRSKVIQDRSNWLI